MNTKFCEYIVKNTVCGKKDRIMSDAIEKYCGDHIDCDLCGLYNDCPYIHRHINPEEVARILGWEIIKNA